MNVNFGAGELLGVVTDMVGFKTGLALASDRIEAILAAAHPSFLKVWTTNRTQPVRLRAEEFEQLASFVLYGVGAVGSPNPCFVLDLLLSKVALAPPEQQDLWMKFHRLFMEDFQALFMAAQNDPTAPRRLPSPGLKDKVFAELGAPGLVIAVEFLKAFDAAQKDLPWSHMRRVEWKDVRELDDLFLSESLKTQHGAFFDQRFVDYLARNLADLDQMHWRQFEGLTAEFFERLGYEVALGKGRNDGGVDARVWQKGDKTGPPLLLIQCKREKTPVELVVVKALWTDVFEERATGGLVVTTTGLARGAERWCKARGYSISGVARNPLRRWVEAMRTPGTGEFMAL